MRDRHDLIGKDKYPSRRKAGGQLAERVMLRRPAGQVGFLEGCRHKPRHARSTRLEIRKGHSSSI